MKNFLIEYKENKNRKANKQYIIDYTITKIKDIDLLNIPVSELYNSINSLQQNLKNIQ